MGVGSGEAGLSIDISIHKEEKCGKTCVLVAGAFEKLRHVWMVEWQVWGEGYGETEAIKDSGERLNGEGR